MANYRYERRRAAGCPDCGGGLEFDWQYKRRRPHIVCGRCGYGYGFDPELQAKIRERWERERGR